VPSSLVSGLSAPIRDLQATVGTGTPEAARTLTGVRRALGELAVATERSWQQTRWVGEAGDAASEFTSATVAAVEALAGRADRLGASATNAADAVARARERLQTIVDEFEARAAALETEIDEPGTADRLVEEARRALSEAEAVVDELRAELDGHRAAVAQPTPGAMPTMPMSSLPSIGSGSGGALGSGGGAGLGSGGGAPAGFSGSSGPLPDPSSDVSDGPRPSADPGVFGSGVTVQLPDGSTATAPNAVAASAVRHALTQLGVPYDWGGTTPGVGLDCSGLTQWAYHEAGLNLPRLAQEQDVGAAVDRTALRPGDLAVWDGHVAMVVGNGLMVEAGDPVKLSAIRTTNAGQGFQGFWRPTA
jgi:peptidoglycan DL-endopeptidase CwlO